MRVAIFLFFISLGKFAQSVMPPTLSEHPFLQSERPFLLSEHLFLLSERPFLQSEQLLIQSECSFLQAEHPFLHAELPLKLFARRDTVIANHAFSVSSHETVISCPAFPIMVISVMINSCSAPLGTKTTIAASTRYGLVLAAIGRVGCCVVAEVCRASTSFCCVPTPFCCVVAGLGSVPALSCCVPVPFCSVVAGIGSGGVDGSVHNLAQRFHDEVALVHQRVGNVQVGLVDVQVVVDEYVDVDGTVVILPVGRLVLAAQLPLYVLGGGEHLAGGERGAATHTGVEEPVGGVKAPRLGFQKD